MTALTEGAAEMGNDRADFLFGALYVKVGRCRVDLAESDEIVLVVGAVQQGGYFFDLLAEDSQVMVEYPPVMCAETADGNGFEFFIEALAKIATNQRSA